MSPETYPAATPLTFIGFAVNAAITGPNLQGDDEVVFDLLVEGGVVATITYDSVTPTGIQVAPVFAAPMAPGETFDVRITYSIEETEVTNIFSRATVTALP